MLNLPVFDNVIAAAERIRGGHGQGGARSAGADEDPSPNHDAARRRMRRGGAVLGRYARERVAAAAGRAIPCRVCARVPGAAPRHRTGCGREERHERLDRRGAAAASLVLAAILAVRGPVFLPHAHTRAAGTPVSMETVSPESMVSRGFSRGSSQPHCTVSSVAAREWLLPAATFGAQS